MDMLTLEKIRKFDDTMGMAIEKYVANPNDMLWRGIFFGVKCCYWDMGAIDLEQFCALNLTNV
jgi:hypothetical protein